VEVGVVDVRPVVVVPVQEVTVTATTRRRTLRIILMARSFDESRDKRFRKRPRDAVVPAPPRGSGSKRAAKRRHRADYVTVTAA
jgi:hypothetical protein